MAVLTQQQAGYGYTAPVDQGKLDAETKKRKEAEERERARLLEEETRASRQKDMAEGRARGAELFGDGKLGRLVEGYSDGELNAFREDGKKGINNDLLMAVRQLRGVQGASNLSGGIARSQNADILKRAMDARAGVDRDVFIKSIADKRDASKYNMEQSAKEKFGQLSSEFGYAGIGAAERGGIMQRIVGERAAETTRDVAREGGKK